MGEVIRVDFGNSRRSVPPAESTQPAAEPNLHELSEEQLMKMAIDREVRLVEANQQLVAGRVSFDEVFDAVAAAMRAGHFLSEEQQIAVAASAQAIQEYRATPLR